VVGPGGVVLPTGDCVMTSDVVSVVTGGTDETALVVATLELAGVVVVKTAALK